MKRLALLCFIVTFALLSMNLGASGVLAGEHTETVDLHVEGMVCPLCENTVESVLNSLDGVVAASADFHRQKVTVEYEPAKLSPEQMVQAINTQTYYQASFTPEYVKTTALLVPGMTSKERAREVANALSKVEGITGVTLQVEGVTLSFDSRKVTPDQIAELIISQTQMTATVASQKQRLTQSTRGSIATATIKVEGMTTARAASEVTAALFLDGIVDGSVNLENSTLTIRYDSNKVTADRIVETLEENLPFAVTLVTVEKPRGGILPWVVPALVLVVALLTGVWFFRRRRQDRGHQVDV